MTNIALEDAACGYKGIIERCFRSLKRTQIKLTPMYHWASGRIESHVKMALIERIAELECGMPWYHIQRALDSPQITIVYSCATNCPIIRLT